MGTKTAFPIPPALWGGASKPESIFVAFAMAEETGPRDLIGAILVKVQEDLYQLKRELYSAHEGKGDLSDIQALETAIERTKMGLKIHVESYLSTINHHVLTTPIEETDKFGRQPSKGWHPVGVPQKPFLFPQEDVCKKREGKRKGKASPLIHPSTKLKTGLHFKIMHDPEHAYHRAAVNQTYGISMPFVNKRKPGRVKLQKIVKGTTIESLSVLPSHRMNPYLTPLPILEKDAKKGILSMIQRGLIPPAAKITFETPPIVPKNAFFHSFKPTKTKPVGRFENALSVVDIDTVKLPRSRGVTVKVPVVMSDRAPSSSRISFSSILKTQPITKPKMTPRVKSKIELCPS